MIPSMRRRDSVINALLGIFLLVVFFACLAAIALVCGLGFIGFEWILRRIFPGWTRPYAFAFGASWTLVLVWYGVGHARKRRRRNAFLFFAIAPIMGWGWALVVPFRSSIGDVRGVALLYCLLPMIAIMGLAQDAALGRLKFFLAAAIISAVVLVNCGLLGYSALSRGAAYGVLGATFLWCFSGVWTAWTGHKPEPPDHSLAPPTASA